MKKIIRGKLINPDPEVAQAIGKNHCAFKTNQSLLSCPVSYKNRWHIIVFLAALFVVCYTPVMAALVEIWLTSADYSHGFLVPLISLYLVLIKRDRLVLLKPQPNGLGGVGLVLLATLILLLGNAGSVVMLQGLSLIVMIAGLVLLVWGPAYLKVLAFPIAYLLLMVPILDAASYRLHWPFQLLSADIGVWLLQSFGFAVFQEAQYIYLPHMTLRVDEGCSGINYLISVIAIGIPLAYFTQRTWLGRVGLTFFAGAIAVLANGLRVALIGAWTYYDTKSIHGPYHIFQGMFVAWIGFVAIFVGAWFLSKDRRGMEDLFLSRKQAGSRAIHWTIREDKGATENRNNRNWSWLAAILILFAIGSYYYLHRITPVHLEKDLRIFPMTIGDWQGMDVDPKNEPVRVRGAHEELVRMYRDDTSHAIRLYIGYFEFQEQGKELVNYLSEKLHVGAEEMEIHVGADQTFRVNRVVLNRGPESRLVLFWYDQNGRLVTNRYLSKFWTAWDGLMQGRTNGALVAVSMPLEPHGDVEKTFEGELAFIREVVFILRGYLPSETT